MTREELTLGYGPYICDLCETVAAVKGRDTDKCEGRWCREIEDKFAQDNGITLTD